MSYTRFIENFITMERRNNRDSLILARDLEIRPDQSFSAPYTLERNSIAERVNRTIVEGARSLLIQAGLPQNLWPYAMKHVVHVRNRVPPFDN